MKKYIVGFGLLLGLVALAASMEPKSWGDVLGYIFGGAAGIAVLLPAINKGIRNWKELLNSKSFWTGISAILFTIQMYLSGQIDLPTAIFAAYGGLVVIFLRDAVASVQATEKARSDRR